MLHTGADVPAVSLDARQAAPPLRTPGGEWRGATAVCRALVHDAIRLTVSCDHNKFKGREFSVAYWNTFLNLHNIHIFLEKNFLPPLKKLKSFLEHFETFKQIF